jgi:hypothetical protein
MKSFESFVGELVEVLLWYDGPIVSLYEHPSKGKLAVILYDQKENSDPLVFCRNRP